MFQKLTPIFILIMFVIGTYFMIKGMDNATRMGKHEERAKSNNLEIIK